MTDIIPQGLPLDWPRYLRNTLSGWEGADHANGPWRPIVGPQSQPPLPVVTDEALIARLLLEQVADLADRIGEHTVKDILVLSNAAAAWLRKNPPGQPIPEPGTGRSATPPAQDPLSITYEFVIADNDDQIVASGTAFTVEEAEREGRRYLLQYAQDCPCVMTLQRVEVVKVFALEPSAAENLWRDHAGNCQSRR
jgi:hypothetical protein